MQLNNTFICSLLRDKCVQSSGQESSWSWQRTPHGDETALYAVYTTPCKRTLQTSSKINVIYVAIVNVIANFMVMIMQSKFVLRVIICIYVAWASICERRKWKCMVDLRLLNVYTFKLPHLGPRVMHTSSAKQQSCIIWPWQVSMVTHAVAG